MHLADRDYLGGTPEAGYLVIAMRKCNMQCRYPRAEPVELCPSDYWTIVSPVFNNNRAHHTKLGSLIVWWKAIILAIIYGLPDGFLKLLWNVRTDSKFLTCSKLDLDSVKTGNTV